MRGARVLVVALVLAACAPPAVQRPVAGVAPAAFPAADYVDAVRRGTPVYRILPDESLVVVEVRRAGSLASLGHDHVVASRDVEGFVAPSLGRADLYASLDGLTVDEPSLRAQAKFDTQPSAEDVAATRSNMLARVLESERFPHAVVHVDVAAASGGAPASVTVALHGATRTLSVPLDVDDEGVRLAASGPLTLKQSDFGIVPFAILGGAIRVEDALVVRFRIRARRIAG